MARDRPLWLVMVAVLLTCSAVRGAGTALTPAPFLKQRSSSSSTYSSPTSRHSSVQAIGPAPFGNHASHVSGKSSRSLHGATQESADGPAPAADSAHKQLLPLSARDVLFFLLAAGTLSLAAASGIGGGVLLVPLLSMVGGFHFIEAVALSNVACFAGAITNLMFNMPRHNPVRPGPLIDYDLLLLFGPPIVMGSVAGAKANYFIPSWITKTLLLVVLVPMVWRMVKKAHFLWVAESSFKRQALAEIHAAAAAADDSDVAGTGTDSVKAAQEAADDGACCIADAAANGTLKSPAAAGTGQGAALHTKLPSLRQADRVPKRCSSAAPAAAAAAGTDDLHNDVRRAFSDTHAGPRAPPHNRSRQNMRPLPEQTPSTDLVDVLGPELMLLTSPAAATAAVQVQHAGRELQRQQSHTRTPQRRFSSFTATPGSSRLDTHGGGSGFRAQSMVTVRSPGSFAAARGSSWVSAERGGTGGGAGTDSAAGRASSGGGGGGSFVGREAAADQLYTAALAPMGGVHSSVSRSSCPDMNNSSCAHHPQQQQQDHTSDAEAGCGICNHMDTVADLKDDCDTAGVITPFGLHQRQLSFRQDSLQRFGSGRRQGGWRGGSFVSRCSSLGHAGSITAGQGQYTIRQMYSPDEEKAAQGKAAADGRATAGAEALELPVVAKSRCMRLYHEDCCHTPELDKLMAGRIEYQMATQYPKIHLAGLLGMLLVVVATAVCSQFVLQCGTWQYWLVVLSPIPVMAAIWALTRWHVLWRVGWQDCLGLLSQAEIAWTPRNTLVYPALCISVGVLAGLLGIGGGSVMAPMLLELGVHPQTSAASSQAAILISAATAAVTYLVNGSVPQDYGITIVLIGLSATLLGQTAITYVVRRTGRNSLLVFILAFLFVAALGLCVGAVGLSVAKIVADPALLMATRKSAVCPSSKTS